MKRTSLLKMLALTGWTLSCLTAAAVAFARPLATPPTITTFSPSNATAGAGFTIVVNGASFETTSTVSVGGIALTTVGTPETTVITGQAAVGTFTAAGNYTVSVSNSEGTAQAESLFTINPGAPAQMSIAPTNSSITAGGAVAYTANVSDSYGNPISTGSVVWLVSSGVGSISSTGTRTANYTSNTAGSATISATLGTLGGNTASVTVNAGAAAQLSLSPVNASVVSGGNLAYAAIVSDAFGNPVSAGTVTWVSSIGSIASTGTRSANFTGSTVGSGTVSATLGAATNSTGVTVTAGAATQMLIIANATTTSAGSPIAFTAYVSDSVGNPVSSGTVTWIVSSGVGSISSTGARTANYSSNTAGSATISATLGTVGGNSVAVTVNPGSASQVSISPANPTVAAGGSIAFTAYVSDSFGNAVSAGTVGWAASIGSIGSTGSRTANFTGSIIGTGKVTATLGAVTNTTNVTVTAGSPAQMTIVANASSMTAGGSIAFTAYVSDSVGNPVSSGTVTWSKLSGVGTISSTGSRTANYTSNTAGTATISATLNTIGGNTVLVTVNPGAASQISIVPANPTVAAGGSIAFTAYVSDSLGNAVSSGTVSWAASIGSIGSTGSRTANFTGSIVGTGKVTATLGAVTNTTNVTINPGAASQMIIRPINASMTAGGSVAFTAYVSDTFGNPVSTGTVMWNKLSGVGNISSTGLRTATFTSTASGTATISATLGTLGGNTASATVNPGSVTQIDLNPTAVTLPVDQSQPFSATPKDTFGNIVNTTVTWSTSDASKGEPWPVTGSSTTFYADTTAGVFTNLLRVSAGGFTRTATITITPGAADNIIITPASASIVVAGTRQFTATVRDVYNNPIPNSTLIWSVSGTQVGTLTTIDIDTVRLNAGTTAGIYPEGLRVTSSGITEAASVTLTPGSLAKVTLNPTSETFLPGETKTFVAQGRDQYDNPISGLSYSWSLNPNVGSIAPYGQTADYTASTTAGVYTNIVRASSGGFTGRATVVVNPADIARIDLSPTSATLTPNATQSFSARAYDAFDNEITSFGVNWSTLGTGSVESYGLTTATIRAGTIAGVYPNAVRASTSGVTATANLTVSAGALAQINVQPAIVVMGANNTQDFTAQGVDAWGNVVPGFSAAWFISGNAGTFDSSSATAAVFRSTTTPGTYDNAITASSGAISGKASVIVLAGTVTSVSITPANVTVGINQTQLFTATVSDAFGNPFPQLSVLWRLSPTNIGTIVSSGPLTALVKMNTQAGTFVDGLQALNGNIQGNATLIVPSGPPTNLNMSVSDPTLTTDGSDSVTIVVTVTDDYGNSVGPGQAVSVVVDECSGTCSLSVVAANTDPQGRVVTALRSEYRSPTGTTSTIKVSASLTNGVVKSINIAGEFIPYRNSLAFMLRDWPDNHTACHALVLNLPGTFQQPADNAFNLYRFVATANAHAVSVSNYQATGQLLLYRIVNDTCATNSTMTVVYLNAASITSASLYQKSFTGLVPGQTYILAVNTTARFTRQVYTVTIAP